MIIYIYIYDKYLYIYMINMLYIYRYPPFSGSIFIYWRVDCFVHLYLESSVDEVQDSGGGKRQTHCRWTGLAMFVGEPSCKWGYAYVFIWIWFMCMYVYIYMYIYLNGYWNYIHILLMSFADPIDMSRGIIKHHPLVIWKITTLYS